MTSLNSNGLHDSIGRYLTEWMTTTQVTTFQSSKNRHGEDPLSCLNDASFQY